MPLGRPSKFKPEYIEQARKLCRLGATDDDLAEFFKVHRDTIHHWGFKHPDFSDAVKRTKEELDAQVERSLFQRAMGYKHRAVKFMQVGGSIVEKEYIEHYPPDATSMIFWLKNRQPQKWRDRREAAPEDDTTPLDDPNEGV